MSIFDRGTETYKSDIILGERYRDKATGIEGKATAVYFFEHACERVAIRYAHDGDIKEATFDAPEVELVSTGVTPVQQKTGGPDRGPASRGSVTRR
jgi:hypothetical protein